MSRFAPFRFVSGLYVCIFRGTPVLVQIFFFYSRSGYRRLTSAVWTDRRGHRTGILALSINEGAYMREIIRAGIDSIDKGQMEAAKSLGMRYGLAMRRIILPQAARVIVPPLGNEFNNMMKTTSLCLHDRRLRALRRCQQGYSKTFHERVLRRGGLLVPRADDGRGRSSRPWIERRLATSERGEELSFRERLQRRVEPGRSAGWRRSAPVSDVVMLRRTCTRASAGSRS